LRPSNEKNHEKPSAIIVIPTEIQSGVLSEQESEVSPVVPLWPVGCPAGTVHRNWSVEGEEGTGQQTELRDGFTVVPFVGYHQGDLKKEDGM